MADRVWSASAEDPLAEPTILLTVSEFREDMLTFATQVLAKFWDTVAACPEDEMRAEAQSLLRVMAARVDHKRLVREILKADADTGQTTDISWLFDEATDGATPSEGETT